MASTDQLKQYLAYWFQLGKPVITSSGTKVLPRPVLQGDRYSFAFEQCWQQLLNANLNQAHLEGTEQSLGELLTPAWELSACARCDMPVPVQSAGVPSLSCPCADLPLWPNTELPQPRSPINNQAQLDEIRKRLQNR